MTPSPAPPQFPRWSRRWLTSTAAALALTAPASLTSAKKKNKKPRQFTAGRCPVARPAGGQFTLVAGVRLAQPVTLSRHGALRRITVTVIPATTNPVRFLIQLVQSSHGVPGNRPQDVIAAAIVRNPLAPGKDTQQVSGAFAGPVLAADSDVAVVVSLIGDDDSQVVMPGGLSATCGLLYVSIDGAPFVTTGGPQALPFTLTVS